MMMDEIRKHLNKHLKYIKIESFEFKTLYGFTFVFKTTFRSMKGEITSADISPVGIIYSENDELYFAPLCDKYDLDEVVRKYCETI